MSLLLIVNSMFNSIERYAFHLDQLYQLDSLFRVLFTMFLMLFGAGVCLKVWKECEVNYIYILQIDNTNRMNFLQLWKGAFMVLTIWLLLLYTFMI